MIDLGAACETWKRLGQNRVGFQGQDAFKQTRVIGRGILEDRNLDVRLEPIQDLHTFGPDLDLAIREL